MQNGHPKNYFHLMTDVSIFESYFYYALRFEVIHGSFLFSACRKLARTFLKIFYVFLYAYSVLSLVYQKNNPEYH